jgi:NAD(P)-dependent dehydrogenase (short-subunit alcohol dehydrogenase family)
MTSKTLIVGASGGIADALIRQCASRGDDVIAVSRSDLSARNYPSNVECLVLAQQDDKHIEDVVSKLKDEGIALNNVIITTGFLHNAEKEIHPEKRLEDVNEKALESYFAINTIIPSLWLKHLVKIMDKSEATVVCLSARVGSISDNGLGGWYGYRASKAALNMFVKSASVEYKRRLKNIMLVCYHPGTVDTSLSKPFQKNVAAKKLFTPDFTAEQLLSHLVTLDREQSCHFIDWDGQVVTW